MTDAQTALAQVREALAARPTPGPWSLKTVPTSDGSCHKIGPFPSASRIHSETHACVYAIGIRLGIDDSTPVARELLANARLMAACSPLNMAAILAHVDAQAAEIERLRQLLCKCNMRTRMVGDGCEFCNPQLAEELEKERR